METKQLTHENLIEKAIEQIKKDIAEDNLTHIHILLNNLKEEDLVHYIPEK